MPWLGALLASLLGTAVSRLLVGAGLGVATFASITPIVLSALNKAASATAGIGGAALQLILMSGLGVGLSAIGAGIMTRIVIESARVAITKSSKS
jgi:hypothetical protein